LLLESAIVTLSAGFRFSMMLKVALAPCSVVTRPAAGTTTMSPC
jgi:hypothetical protein